MAEPEDLLLEGAHLATRVARDAWRRYRHAMHQTEVTLADERLRLELFLAALFMQPITIAPAQPPAPTTWLGRLARGRTPSARERELLPGTDGARVFLPPSLPLMNTAEQTREVSRWKAVE